MKAPVCRVCAITGVLCPSCSEKYRRGVLTDLDIEVAKHMFELEPRYQGLKDLEMVKSYQVKTRGGRDAVLVIVRHPSRLDPLFLQSLSKQLSNRLKRPARVVQESKDMRRLVSQIINPARVISVSTVWLPDGSIEYDVIVGRRDSNRMFLSLESVKSVLYEIVGQRVRFTFI